MLTHSNLYLQLIQDLFKDFFIYSVDGQCCLSYGGGGDGLVSAPTQFPENPKHTSLRTTAMAKCCER